MTVSMIYYAASQKKIYDRDNVHKKIVAEAMSMIRFSSYTCRYLHVVAFLLPFFRREPTEAKK